MWDYHTPGWARRFFDNWRDSLNWQRLPPYETFADLVERHRDGIVPYCQEDNEVALGFVEGLNNTIRVIQRKIYGLRDEESFRLKVLTAPCPRYARPVKEVARSWHAGSRLRTKNADHQNYW